jgi:hypothetical protein
MQDDTKKIIGRAEKLNFPELEISDVPARIDTGAKTSSLWASEVVERDGKLTAVLFGQGNPAHTGQPVTFTEFDTTIVASSTGHTQERYKVRLLVKLKGKKVRAWFTLADRSTQVYPVLIGRNVLLGKFVVDVKKGHVLKEAEQKRTEELRAKGEEEK